MAPSLVSLMMLFAFACCTSALLSPTPLLIGWKFRDMPDYAIKEIIYPMKISKAAHSVGWFYAQGFFYGPNNEVAYIGLQPQTDSATGRPRVRGVFSSFIYGTRQSHENCYDGADGLKHGASCAIIVEASFDHPFNLSVSTLDNRKWQGKLIDTVTLKEWIIGEWTLPNRYRGISKTGMGLIEYWSLNTATQIECTTMPGTDVTFGNPYSPNNGGELGSLSDPFPAGACAKGVKWDVKTDNFGREIQVKSVMALEG